MHTDRSKKYGDLRVVAGGLSRRELSPEQRFERDFRDWAARGKVGGNGRYATRALADTAEGLRFPNRIPARVLGQALENGASLAWALELPDILEDYIIRKARASGLKVDDIDVAA